MVRMDWYKPYNMPNFINRLMKSQMMVSMNQMLYTSTSFLDIDGRPIRLSFSTHGQSVLNFEHY